MIDQSVSVQEDKAPIVVVKPAEGSPAKSTENQASTKMFTEVYMKEAHRIVNATFGSRASLIVRAALNDRNRPANNIQQTPPNQRKQSSTTNTPETQQATPTTPPVIRARSSKNKVLFTDPVVSREYKYEPTPVIQHLCREKPPTPLSPGDNCNNIEQQHKQMTPESRRTLLNRRKSQLLQARSISIQKPEQEQEEEEEDDEDEDYVLASPDVPCMMDLNKKSPIKRPHELTLTSSEEDDESFQEADCRKLPKISSSQDDGCSLFSSPKVAKIAPYYHDELDEESKRTDLKDGERRAKELSNARTDAQSCATGPSLFSYLRLSTSVTKGNLQQQQQQQHQISDQCKTELSDGQQRQSIFGLLGSLWSRTTSYLSPEQTV